MEIRRAHSLYRNYLFGTERVRRRGAGNEIAKAGLRAGQLFDGRSRGRPADSASGPTVRHGGDRQSSVWRRSNFERDRRETIAGLGGGVRLSFLGAVSLEVDHWSSGGDLCDSGDVESGAPGR